ncbi:MAG: hypothetical protein Q8O47_00645 [Candidatus Bathyarchaeota archaeon]|nr:hypothetical protein [Candidatus Bathyarchaeota archaeon]
MYPDCSNGKCLFQHEDGCLDCRVCAYCGSVIDATNTTGGHDEVHSLLDACSTTVPACERCRASKNSTRLKTWLKDLREKDPAYFGLILDNHMLQQNTVSLIVKRVAQETRFKPL